MTREQEYLAHDFTDDDIEYCKGEARKLDALHKANPLTDEEGFPVTNDDGNPMTYNDWLTFVMREHKVVVDHWRGQYCAEMGGV